LPVENGQTDPVGQSKLGEGMLDGENGDFLGNGAMTTHHSSATSRACTAVDVSVTHWHHLLSRGYMTDDEGIAGTIPT